MLLRLEHVRDTRREAARAGTVAIAIWASFDTMSTSSDSVQVLRTLGVGEGPLVAIGPGVSRGISYLVLIPDVLD